MSDIYVVIRNQSDTAMPSVEGELLVVMLTTEGIVYRQTTASLRVAAAFFRNIPGGQYSILVRHSVLNPTEARYDVNLPERAIFGVRFVYDEPSHQLLKIESETRFLDD
ncbi:MAG: hypothetical protein KME42_24930 [Tildeniella nuda ZEHNDER 1965/U140]|nr:hypothetical protein [Tildeniella nuda ZEHNDER 1965/U140]